MLKLWGRLGLLVAVTTVSAFGAESSKAVSGNIEGGLRWGSSSTVSGLGWLVDSVNLRHQFDVSDKTRVVIGNQFHATGPSMGTPGSFNNDVNFAPLRTMITGGMLSFGFNAAYVDHKVADGVRVQVGALRTAFGMEGMWDRYAHWTYYYSMGAVNSFNAGWQYDLGLKATITDMFPGKLEVAVLDARQVTQDGNTGAINARYSMDIKNGDNVITPVASVYAGRFTGEVQDLGFTAGLQAKMGAMMGNLEFVYAKSALGTGPTALAPKAANYSTWSVYAEPAMDLGLLTASLKFDFYGFQATQAAASLTDMNLGVALTKNYSDKSRCRLTYQLASISKKANADMFHDVRLMWGTSF